MTLACEVAYSKLAEVVTVAYFNDEDPVGNSLLQIWKLWLVKSLTFVQTLSTRFGQDLKLMLRRDFEVEVWSVFCC